MRPAAACWTTSGLGYLRLGQSATTLSGGEAQRVKLAAHLAAASCEGTLFIFDEPTTGLHFDDIAKLLAAFERLIENDACQGDGTVTVEMQFLADVELVCEECKGTRFKNGILEIRYGGLNIHEALQLTVREAMHFFQAAPRLVRRLKVLDDVGLGYLRLGQSATTLSGGEAQRVKLAAHLALASCEGALFIFDEPTTGLHFDDISKLLASFQRLIENGGSLIVIEHNLDVIKAADWVIDLGPEGGEAGGRVVAAGTPATVAAAKNSYTGQYLRRVL